MTGHEVKEIHAHRERQGKLDYLVEWKDEKFKGRWDFCERHKMRCSELIKAYTKKRELIKYWQKILDCGTRSLENDMTLAKKPTQLPVITDFRSAEEDDDSNGLPMIMDANEKENEDETEKAQEKAVSDSVKFKAVFKKLIVRDVPYVLCEMENGIFKWLEVTSLVGNKMLLQFYLIEQILKSEAAKEGIIDLAGEESASARKKRKYSSSSSSSNGKSPSELLAGDVSAEQGPHSSGREKSNASMMCDVCDKTFTTFADFSDHMRNHSRYECCFCNKQFNWRSLPAHLKTQHKSKKGLCCVCGKAAKTLADCKNNCRATKGKRVEKKPAGE